MMTQIPERCISCGIAGATECYVLERQAEIDSIGAAVVETRRLQEEVIADLGKVGIDHADGFAAALTQIEAYKTEMDECLSDLTAERDAAQEVLDTLLDHCPTGPTQYSDDPAEPWLCGSGEISVHYRSTMPVRNK